jgi:hypothetical protein
MAFHSHDACVANELADKPEKAISRPTLFIFEFNSLFQYIRHYLLAKKTEFAGDIPLFMRK